MNRFFKQAVSLGLLLGLFSLVPLHADEMNTPSAAPPPPSATTTMGGSGAETPGGSPAAWTSRLGLTDEQSTKLMTAFKAQREAMVPLIEQRHQAIEKLRQQLETQAKDADIQSTLDVLVQSEKAVQAENDSFRKTLDGFLTPTQRGKLLVGMLGRGRQRMMHGGQMGGEQQGEPGQK